MEEKRANAGNMNEWIPAEDSSIPAEKQESPGWENDIQLTVTAGIHPESRRVHKTPSPHDHTHTLVCFHHNKGSRRYNDTGTFRTSEAQCQVGVWFVNAPVATPNDSAE